MPTFFNHIFHSADWKALLAKIDLITQQNVKIMDFFTSLQALLTNIDTDVAAVGAEITNLENTVAQLQAAGTLTAAQAQTLLDHATAIGTALTNLEPPVVAPPVVGS
jgi:small-conductance mechanosensitive channel